MIFGGGRGSRGEGTERKEELSKAGGEGRRKKGVDIGTKLVTKSHLFLLYEYH